MTVGPYTSFLSIFPVAAKKTPRSLSLVFAFYNRKGTAVPLKRACLIVVYFLFCSPCFFYLKPTLAA